MKKIIILITSFILCLSLCSCGYFFYKCYSYNEVDKTYNKISQVKDDIKKLDKQIEEKNKEIENLKKDNGEKGEVLELWQKAVNQVKKDS